MNEWINDEVDWDETRRLLVVHRNLGLILGPPQNCPEEYAKKFRRLAEEIFGEISVAEQWKRWEREHAR